MKIAHNKYLQCCLTVIFILVLFCLAITLISNILLKSEVNALAIYAGTLQAIDDFEDGKVVLYEPMVDTEKKFTGIYKQGIEVWYWPYQKEIFSCQKMTANFFTEAYNKKIIFLVEAERAQRNGEPHK